MNDTPRTDRAGEDGMYSTMVNHALRLELELNAAMQAIRDIYANEYNSLETYSICERILPKEEHSKP